jgi:hypothetical protein
MNASEATLMILTLFLLRLALPIFVTAIFGYGMNRLVAYWNAKVEL